MRQNKEKDDSEWTHVSYKNKEFKKNFIKKDKIIRAKRTIKSIIDLDKIQDINMYNSFNNNYMYDTDISSDEDKIL